MASLGLSQSDRHVLRTVRSNSLFPQQQITARNLLRSADCYQQQFMKFPHIGIFHSYAELLHAALLESNRDISVFVPQPFLLHIGNRRYTPDCYFVNSGMRQVIELKPRGEMKEDLRIPVQQYFEQERIEFKVISNDDVFAQERLALNWLKIIRILISASHESTHNEEVMLLNMLFEHHELELGDIIFVGDRIGQRKIEIALFRLVHQGKLNLDIIDKVLAYSTKVTLCA